MERSLVLVGVPIDSVGRAGGTEHAPGAFRAAVGPDQPWSRDAGDLDVWIRGDVRDPVTGVVASDDVLTMTRSVAGATEALVGAGEVPFLIGGCCSLLPGAFAGAQRAKGETAVVSVDGHLDLYDGRTSPTGEAADMPMSVVLGRGPAAWQEAAGATVEGRYAAILGYRDLEEALGYGHPHPDAIPELTHVDVGGVRADPRGVGEAVASTFTADPGSFWVHLDVDVLDEVVFPATDYLMPGGLDLSQLAEMLHPLLSSTAIAGIPVGCYNPEKDPDGSCGAALVELLRDPLT